MDEILSDKNIYEIGIEQYPYLLQEIKNPPPKLYVRGQIPNNENKFLCVIGSRKNSEYGKEVCKTLIQGLKGYSIVIVSGLAIGIDSIAHECALDAGLKTIAFPGSGLYKRSIYPYSKINLAERIISSGGCLLSPFPNYQTSTNWTFPARNTLMAGISHAVLVIEARKDSGTMITVNEASRFGRDLLAIPGNIFYSLCEGPNKLLREGGIAITCSEDILEALGFDIYKNKETKIKIPEIELNEKQKLVYDAIDISTNRDNILLKTSLSIEDISIVLTELESMQIIYEEDGFIQRKK